MPDLKLHIPAPCHENWHKMLPDEHGRFCQQCNKPVVDFTNLSDVAIIEHFKGQTKSVCGRLRHSQLKQYHTTAFAPSEVIPLKILLTTGLAISALSVSAQDAPHKPVYTQLQQTSLPAPGNIKQTEPDTTIVYTIKGQVWSGEEQGAPLPGVSVVLKGTNKGVSTDANGYFNLTLQEEPKKPIVIQFLYIGFETTERTISFNETQTTDLGKVYLLLDDQVLIGEVVIVNTNPISRLWCKMKSIF